MILLLSVIPIHLISSVFVMFIVIGYVKYVHSKIKGTPMTSAMLISKYRLLTIV